MEGELLRRYKTLIKSMIFMMTFIIVMSFTNTYFAYHHSATRNKIDQIYKVEEKADIVIIGNSHASRSFNPYIIDNILKTESIILSTPGQNLKQTYFLLEEVFNNRGAELIVLEMFSFIHAVPEKISTDNEHIFSSYRDIANEMPISLLKLEMAMSLVKPESILDFMIPIVNSHELWKDLDKVKSNFTYQFDSNSKGSVSLLKSSMTQENADHYRNDDYFHEYKTTEENKEWFNKIVELINSNDARLITVMAPIFSEFAAKLVDRNEAYILDQGIEFFDMNEETKIAEYNFNFMDEEAYKNDRINSNQHLSNQGLYEATRVILPKIAEYMGINNYFWNENEYDFNSYLNSIEKKGKILIVGYFNKDKKEIPSEAFEGIEKLGMNLEKIKSNSSGFNIRYYNDDGVDVKQYFTNEQVNTNFKEHPVLSELELPFDLKINNLNNKSMVINVDGKMYNTARDGLMILVYDIENQKIVDKAFFDLTESLIRFMWY